MATITRFLLDEAGTYQLSPDLKTILFPTGAVAGRYNTLLGQLNDLVAQQNNLNADVAAYQSYAAEGAKSLATQQGENVGAAR